MHKLILSTRRAHLPIESSAKCAKLAKTGTDARFGQKSISRCQVANGPASLFQALHNNHHSRDGCSP